MSKKISVVPNLSFSKELDKSHIMIQFDDDEPVSVLELLDPKSVVTFELQNTQFSSIEFSDSKSNKKFKIFIKKKEE